MSSGLFELPSAAAPAVADVEARPEEKHTRSFRLPYHLGLYLATNAIPEVCTVIDGPDCLYRKAEWVHGKRDPGSTLRDAFGEHRIVSTLLYSTLVIKSDGSEVRRRIERVARIRGAGAILVCSMPHVVIIGTQYDRILAELAKSIRMLTMQVPSRSLAGDWPDGYDETLPAIARHLALPSIDRSPGRVAVIGHLMDRTEADQWANGAELRRLLGGLGLEVTSVWLEGQRFEALADAQSAGLVVALPHARGAAHALAERTGAKVVDAALPFGLRQTTRAFLRQVAAAADRRVEAEAFIAKEQARLVPRVEWAVPHYLAGARVAFVGDPFHFEGFVSLAEELGMSVTLLAGSARKPEGSPCRRATSTRPPSCSRRPSAHSSG